MASSNNPWEPMQPTAAGLMLARALSAGVVSQVGRLVLSLQIRIASEAVWISQTSAKP